MSEAMLTQAAMLGLSSETAWGTANTTPTYWMPLVRSTIERARPLTPAPHLGGIGLAGVGAVAPVQRDYAILSDTVAGDLEIIPAYDQKATALFLLHCFGAAPVTTDNMDGTYTHVFSLGLLPGSTYAGLTAHVLHGYHSTTNPLEQFYGLMCSRFELSCKSGEYARLVGTWVGKSSAGLVASTGTPVSVAVEEIQGNHFGTLSWNSLTITLNSFKVTVDKHLSNRMHLGSLFTDRPVPTALYETMVEFEVDLTTDDGYVAFLAGTQSDGSITMTGATSPNALTLALPNMVIESLSKPVDRDGALIQTIKARCFGVSAGTKLGLKATLTNANAAAV